MLRAIEARVLGAGTRRLAGVGLLAIGAAIAPLVLRAKRKVVANRPATIEIGRIEFGGERYGAVYEDGRLVGVLEGVERL